MGRPATDSESLVSEVEADELDPEYRGTRGIAVGREVDHHLSLNTT